MRRIGNAIREQLGLLGLADRRSAETGARRRRTEPAGEDDAVPLADVVSLPRRREGGRGRRRQDR